MRKAAAKRNDASDSNFSHVALVCSRLNPTAPGAAMQVMTGCANFDADFRAIAQLTETNIASAEHLTSILHQIYRRIFDVDLHRYDVEALHAAGPAALNFAHGLRTALGDRIQQWHAGGFMSPQAQGALRDVFRASRYATDMLGEMLIAYDDLSPGETIYPAFTGPHNNTQIHPALADASNVEFQSGDVIVMRGIIYNSAAIARIGDVDSQFSHAAMVHIDDRGHRTIVEALIADGAKLSSFDYSMSHNLARAVLFRHHDADLAAKAADRIFKRVQESQRSWKNHIYYDFSMELDNYDELFCAKLVRQAYDEASHGLLRLPTFPTTFEQANADFMARIGTTAKTTFAPGDMELEPDFHTIAEWRDFRRTSLIRLQDMVLVKMFEWMETDGYSFRETNMMWIISSLSKASGYLPNIVKAALSRLVPKIPRNISREAIAVIAMLHKTAQPLHQELMAMERRSIKDTGRPLHPREIYAHLDQVKQRSAGQIGYLMKA